MGGKLQLSPTGTGDRTPPPSPQRPLPSSYLELVLVVRLEKALERALERALEAMLCPRLRCWSCRALWRGGRRG